MKNKYLRVTMPDGSKWDVPLEVIAKNRAGYYAAREAKEIVNEKKKKRKWTEVFAKEYKITMESSFEVEDWATNNMDWDEVRDKAECEKLEVDYQEGWMNGDKEIIKK